MLSAFLQPRIALISRMEPQIAQISTDFCFYLRAQPAFICVMFYNRELHERHEWNHRLHGLHRFLWNADRR